LIRAPQVGVAACATHGIHGCRAIGETMASGLHYGKGHLNLRRGHAGRSQERQENGRKEAFFHLAIFIFSTPSINPKRKGLSEFFGDIQVHNG